MKLAPILTLLASSWGCSQPHAPAVSPEALLDPALQDQPLPEDAAWAGRMLSVLPRVRNAVQFSDALSAHPEEDRCEQDLDAQDPEVRLRAVFQLVQARAPRSAQRQWDTWNDLRDELSNAEDLKVHAALGEDFASRSLVQTLDNFEPDVAAGGTDAQWAIRMIGVTGRTELLGRVAAYATSSDLHLSLTAGRTLEDFKGAAANEALLGCVQAWRYDTFLRAARALQVRDAELLEAGLIRMGPPDDRRAWYGILLGRLGSAHAVSSLCEEVGSMSRVDAEMFAMIEALAQPEHRELIEGLPDQVRDGQRERAEQVVAAVRNRWSDESR